jgi:hypothetical protein
LVQVISVSILQFDKTWKGAKSKFWIAIRGSLNSSITENRNELPTEVDWAPSVCLDGVAGGSWCGRERRRGREREATVGSRAMGGRSALFRSRAAEWERRTPPLQSSSHFAYKWSAVENNALHTNLKLECSEFIHQWHS